MLLDAKTRDSQKDAIRERMPQMAMDAQRLCNQLEIPTPEQTIARLKAEIAELRQYEFVPCNVLRDAVKLMDHRNDVAVTWQGRKIIGLTLAPE